MSSVEGWKRFFCGERYGFVTFSSRPSRIDYLARRGRAMDDHTAQTGRSGRATIYDVARHAGVAISTVSRVLNDAEDVSPQTRERVLRVVDKLQYRPHRTARSLAHLYAQGILPIAAAGNDGNTRTSYPAGYASVGAVAALAAVGDMVDFSRIAGSIVLARCAWFRLRFPDGTVSGEWLVPGGESEQWRMLRLIWRQSAGRLAPTEASTPSAQSSCITGRSAHRPVLIE